MALLALLSFLARLSRKGIYTFENQGNVELEITGILIGNCTPTAFRLHSDCTFIVLRPYSGSITIDGREDLYCIDILL
jgi:hypothetical protein